MLSLFMTYVSFSQNTDCTIYRHLSCYFNKKAAMIKKDFVYDDSLTNPITVPKGKMLKGPLRKLMIFML